MRRVKHLLLSVAATGLLAATAGPVLAQATTGSLIGAGAELTTEILSAATANGQPPRLSDAGAAAGIRAAFDVSVLGSLAKADLSAILPVCGSAAEPMMLYILFGLKPDALSDSSAAGAAAAVQRINENALRYQDEISLALRFGIRCMSTMIPALERHAAALPAADRPLMREGLDQSRRGAVQTYTGVFMTATEATTRTANRDLVLDEAVAQADVYASLLSRAERQQLVAVADSFLPKAPDASVRTRFQKIRDSMSRTDCGMICAL
jgi:hypothetical protein